jgi:hypothetical protein
MLPKLLIISKRNLHTAPRVIREIETFKNNFNVIAVGYVNPNQATNQLLDIKQYDLSIVDKLIRKIFLTVPLVKKHFYNHVYLSEYKKLKTLVQQQQPKILIIHETEMLPVAFKIREKTGIHFKIVYNAHEYHPLEYDTPTFIKNDKVFFEKLYAKYVVKTDLLVNVCESIRLQCLKDFGKDSLVVPNAAQFVQGLQPSEVNNTIKLIHHGGSIAARKLEVMIHMMDVLPSNYKLDFMLVPNDPEYYNKLVQLAKNNTRINFIEPVGYNKIVATINKYDIGVYTLNPGGFNQQIALPNKVYEFIQARLCLAVTPNTEMKNLVLQNNLGVVANDYTAAAMADAILSITPEQLYQFKLNSHKSAEQLSAEKYAADYLTATLKLI